MGVQKKGNGKDIWEWQASIFLHWKGQKGYSQALFSIGKEMKAKERQYKIPRERKELGYILRYLV